MTIFETIRLLEAARLHFSIKRSRPDTILLVVTLVGERLEIDVFEDGHLELSRFRGDESVQGGEDLLERILKGYLLEQKLLEQKLQEHLLEQKSKSV